MKMKRTMKIKILLCLLLTLTTLASAGFFSPKPPSTVLKQGEEGVKVEVEKGDGNTKVLISPPEGGEAHGDDEGSSRLTHAKEKLSETIEGAKKKLAGEGDEVEEEETAAPHARFSPRELVCDAYGKCKHKVASVFGQTKEATEETADAAADKAGETKDVLSQTTDKVAGKAGETEDVLSQTAEKVAGKAREAADKAQVKSEAAVKDAYGSFKDKAYDVAHGAKETAGEVKEEAKERAKGGAQKGKKGFKSLLHRTATVVSYLVPWRTMASATGVLHLLGFSVAYGTSLWVTFASSYVLAHALPRTQFAMVQSKIYPLYFRAMGSSIGLAMLGHLMGPRKMFSSLSMAALGSSLVMTLANSLFLEPRATKVMFERMKKEKEEGIGKPTSEEATPPQKAEATTQAITGSSSGDRLRQLNSYSSLLNAATLVSLTWHLVYLGKNLHYVC